MKLSINYLIILSAFLFISCEGAQGPTGPEGSGSFIASSVPANPQPPDDGQLYNIDLFDYKILLSWSIHTNYNENVRFDIYFGDTVPSPLVVENVTTPYVLVDPPVDSSSIVWQVVVKIDEHQSMPGPLWRFDWR